MVLEPTRLAVLDHGLVVRMNPWPQLGVELFARGTRRAHHLAVALAIAHHQRVDDRLLLTLWHLANGGGVSCRRASSCRCHCLTSGWRTWSELTDRLSPSAMGELTASGALSRRDDGIWVLHGAPPAQIGHHRLVAAMS